MIAIQELNALLMNLSGSTIEFIPALIGALLLLVIGYIVGKVIGTVIEKICTIVKIDKYIKCQGFKLSKLFKIAGEWIIYLVFIQSAVQYLGIFALAMFVNEVIYFIPRAVGAAIIVVVGYILGGFFEEQIRHSHGVYKNLVGRIVNFFTVYVAIALALPFLGINPGLVNNILLIIIASVGLAFALAVGLGLKDIVSKEANKYVGVVEKSIRKRR